MGANDGFEMPRLQITLLAGPKMRLKVAKFNAFWCAKETQVFKLEKLSAKWPSDLYRMQISF